MSDDADPWEDEGYAAEDDWGEESIAADIEGEQPEDADVDDERGLIEPEPGAAPQRIANPERPSGLSLDTDTRSTAAPRGPVRHSLTMRSTASRSPSSTASTVPFALLRIQPDTPAACAARRTVSRKKTPCTRPQTTTR
jgi:hypothetical protein